MAVLSVYYTVAMIHNTVVQVGQPAFSSSPLMHSAALREVFDNSQISSFTSQIVEFEGVLRHDCVIVQSFLMLDEIKRFFVSFPLTRNNFSFS